MNNIYIGVQQNDLLFMVCDNAKVVIHTANLLDVYFIGCASHRFNLAVQSFLDDEDRMNILNKVDDLMSKLKTLK